MIHLSPIAIADSFKIAFVFALNSCFRNSIFVQTNIGRYLKYQDQEQNKH